jgi:hypothetical protein
MTLPLQPQTEFRIDDYNYNGKNDGQEKGFFSLLRGGLRTISGYIGKGNRDAYKVTTSVATIGIRGTEWTGSLVPGASPEETELTLNTGEGAIEACNASGCITIAGGEAAVVSRAAPTRRRICRRPRATTHNRRRRPRTLQLKTETRMDHSSSSRKTSRLSLRLRAAAALPLR